MKCNLAEARYRIEMAFYVTSAIIFAIRFLFFCKKGRCNVYLQLTLRKSSNSEYILVTIDIPTNTTYNSDDKCLCSVADPGGTPGAWAPPWTPNF